MKTEENNPEAKERILNAAVRLFARKGYSATGLRELAREADVNLAMINYYFGSKRELLKAVFDQCFEKHFQIVAKLRELNVPPEELIRRAAKMMVDLFRENPDWVRVVFAEMAYEVPEFEDYKAERIREVVRPMLAELIPAMQAKSPRQLSPMVVGPAFIGVPVFHFLMRPVLQKMFGVTFDEQFYEEYPTRLAEMWLYGLCGVPPEEGAAAKEGEKR